MSAVVFRGLPDCQCRGTAEPRSPGRDWSGASYVKMEGHYLYITQFNA